jgi:hypothetical protein
MTNFAVVTESGLCRTTSHRYKLFFEADTVVQMCENNTIDPHGLSLCSIGDVCRYGPDHEYLVG